MDLNKPAKFVQCVLKRETTCRVSDVFESVPRAERDLRDSVKHPIMRATWRAVPVSALR